MNSYDIATGRPVEDSQFASATNYPMNEPAPEAPGDVSDLEITKPLFFALKPDTKGRIYAITQDGFMLAKPYEDFILTSIRFTESERVSMTEMEGDFTLIFLDTAPVPVEITMVVYNSDNHQWRDNFRYYYRTYLRGTSLAKNKAIGVLTIDGLVITGAFTGLAWGEDSGDLSDAGVKCVLSAVVSAESIYPVSLGMKGNVMETYQYPENISMIIRELISKEQAGAIPASQIGVQRAF